MFVFVGVTVGFFITDGGVVFVVGVVVVFVVTAGFVVTVGLVVVVGFVVTAGLVATVGFVVNGFLVVAGLVVTAGFVIAGLVVDVSVGFVIDDEDGDVIVEVTGRFTGAPVPDVEIEGREPEPSEVIEPEVRPVNEGRSLNSRMTLSSGARSRPLASGSCLLDVRFFRIAMSYPVFFTNEVKPAMLLTGLRFAVLAKVLGGATVVGFLTGTAF